MEAEFVSEALAALGVGRAGALLPPGKYIMTVVFPSPQGDGIVLKSRLQIQFNWQTAGASPRPTGYRGAPKRKPASARNLRKQLGERPKSLQIARREAEIFANSSAKTERNKAHRSRQRRRSDPTPRQSARSNAVPRSPEQQSVAAVRGCRAEISARQVCRQARLPPLPLDGVAERADLLPHRKI